MSNEIKPQAEPTPEALEVQGKAPEGFRRLELGEIIQEEDRAFPKDMDISGFEAGNIGTYCAGRPVVEGMGNAYFRPLPKGGAPRIELGSNEVDGFAPNTGEGSAIPRISGGLDLEGAKRFVAEKRWVPIAYFESMAAEIAALATLRESHEALAKALEAARFRLRDIEKYDGIASPSTMAIIDAALTQGGDTK
jgi:hypothetical protein